MPSLSSRLRKAYRRHGIHGILLVAVFKISRLILRRLVWFYAAIMYVKRMSWSAVLEPTVSFDTSRGNIVIGDNTYLGKYCRFICSADGTVIIGSWTTLIHAVVIGCQERIEIGNDVMIGEFVSIRDSQHVFGDTQIIIAKQGENAIPIKIEDNVWIGRGVIIMPGVTIGTGSVIGANSVCTKSIPQFSVAVGAPAKVIRSRST